MGSESSKVVPDSGSNVKNKDLAEELENYKEALTWDVEKVSEFLEKQNFKNELIDIFRRERISGSDLLIMDKSDVIDLGVSVGDRLRLIRLLARYKYVQEVLRMTTVVWSGKEFEVCPCMPFNTEYNLTRATLHVTKTGLFRKSVDRVDLSAVTDVDYYEETFTGTIRVTSMDPTLPVLFIPLWKSEGERVYKQIADAWELDQQHLANSQWQEVTTG